MLIILHQLSSVTSYFDVHSPSITDYEDKDISKIHLAVEEPPWDPSTSVYSERETQMLDHQGQNSIHATAARGPVFVSAVVSYSLAYNAADVMDDVNLVTALEAQIQISVALMGMVGKPSIDPIVSAKKWGITPEKAQKTIKATTQRGIRTMPSLSRWFRMNIQNLCYHHMAHPVFSDTMFASTVYRRGNRCAQVYAMDFWWARPIPMASRSEANETL